MIYFNNKQWNKSVEKLFETKELTNTEVIPFIQKELNKGNNIYLMFNPYNSEIENTTTCIYASSNDEVLNNYYTLQEEV